jgi:hypothetical protein
MNKVNYIMKTHLLILGVIGGACLALNTAQAINLTLGVGTTGTDVLGQVVPGVAGLPGGQAANDLADINGLLALALGGTSGTSPKFTRSLNNFGTLPTPTTTGAVLASGVGSGTGQITVSGSSAIITLGGAFNYLVGAYDGPNGGAEVWYIGGSGLGSGDTITIPANAEPISGILTASTRYQITTWTLFNPGGTPPQSIPDGGTTALLLGAALSGLGLLRRKLS